MHDTIEDTDTSVEELVEAFGGPVASLVQEVTDDKRLPKAERQLLQVEHAAHLSPKARYVKLADKIARPEMKSTTTLSCSTRCRGDET